MKDSLFVMLVVLGCLCLAAYLGMRLRRMLPEKHFKGESGDAIKLATGLMATLVALVLSLLISSANNVRTTIEAEYTHSLASVDLLDRYLADYGPETGDIRQIVRRTAIGRFREIWPEEQFDPAATGESRGGKNIDAAEQRLLQLAPAGEAQTWYRSQALQALANLAQDRWLALNQTAGSMLPMPMLVVLIAWAAIIFVSFGLFAEHNPTVYATLFLCALATAVAVFLILELNTPFVGLIKISSGPAHALLEQLGH